MAWIKRRETASGTRWDVRYQDPDRKRRTKTCKSEREARTVRTRIESSLIAGSYVDPAQARVTLRDYVATWQAAQLDHEPGTRRVLQTVYGHLLPVLGDRALGSITRSDVQGWVSSLAKKMGPASVETTYGWFATIMRAAVLDGKIVRTPCVQVKRPKVQVKQVVPLTVTEVMAIANAMPARYRAMVLFGAATGLRWGELAGLTEDHVNWAGPIGAPEADRQRTVRVDRQWTRERCFGPTKTAASVRTVPIDPGTAQLLAGHLAEFPALAPHGLIFHDGRKPLAANRFQEVWAAALRTAGTRHAVVHDLRHFYASALIAMGVDPKTVQCRMGHKNLSETTDTYGHLWPDAEEKTRLAIAAVFGTAEAV